MIKEEGSTVDIDATALAIHNDGRASTTHQNEPKPAVKSIEPSGEMVSQPVSEVKKNPDEVADFSGRNPTETSNRALLVNALEATVQTDWEKKMLQEYKDKIQQIEADEQKMLAAKK